jgi:hypothetical protein
LRVSFNTRHAQRALAACRLLAQAEAHIAFNFARRVCRQWHAALLAQGRLHEVEGILHAHDMTLKKPLCTPPERPILMASLAFLLWRCPRSPSRPEQAQKCGNP